MKIRPLTFGLIVGVVIGFGLTKIFNSDAKTSVKPAPGILTEANKKTYNEKWQWPDSLDAVKAAPQNHQVIFENDKIRILEVILRPYEFEQMHTHSLPSVMFGGQNADTSHFAIIYYRYGYDPTKHRYYVKDSVKQHSGGSNPDKPNKGHYMKPEGPHGIKNLSNVKIDVFRVEFKPAVKNN
jgi:hypothetical protein